jgi:hypothetical protein
MADTQISRMLFFGSKRVLSQLSTTRRWCHFPADKFLANRQKWPDTARTQIRKPSDETDFEKNCVVLIQGDSGGPERQARRNEGVRSRKGSI